MDVSRRHINVHIDEVIVEGDGPVDRAAAAAAVQQELALLVARNPIATHRSRSVGTLAVDEGGAVRERSGEPHGVGASIARAVHGGLTSR